MVKVGVKDIYIFLLLYCSVTYKNKAKWYKILEESLRNLDLGLGSLNYGMMERPRF